jgi:hypothetical protein
MGASLLSIIVILEQYTRLHGHLMGPRLHLVMLTAIYRCGKQSKEVLLKTGEKRVRETLFPFLPLSPMSYFCTYLGVRSTGTMLVTVCFYLTDSAMSGWLCSNAMLLMIVASHPQYHERDHGANRLDTYQQSSSEDKPVLPHVSWDIQHIIISTREHKMVNKSKEE